MNADTGRIYALPEISSSESGDEWWPPAGHPIKASDMPSEGMLKGEQENLAAELRAAFYDRQEPLMTVGSEAAHKITLGERELRRRRNRQQRNSRKRNR